MTFGLSSAPLLELSASIWPSRRDDMQGAAATKTSLQKALELTMNEPGRGQFSSTQNCFAARAMRRENGLVSGVSRPRGSISARSLLHRLSTSPSRSVSSPGSCWPGDSNFWFIETRRIRVQRTFRIVIFARLSCSAHSLPVARAWS